MRTRGAKPEIDRVLQRSQDRALARQHGLDLERFVAEAKERSQTLERVPERDREHAHARVAATEPALRAVREAAAILTERDAAFTARSLEQRARQMSLGTARAEQIDQAVAQLQSRGELVERQVRAIDPVTRHPTLLPGFTTAAMIQTERRMLALEQAGRGAVDRFMHRLDAQALVGSARALAEERGFGWTHGQAEATKGVLTTSARVLGIQGYAGTAKTTTVLATVAEAARQQGYTVKGMAPTTEATLGLAQAIGGEAVTVQRQVAELERGMEGRGVRQHRRQAAVDRRRGLAGRSPCHAHAAGRGHAAGSPGAAGRRRAAAGLGGGRPGLRPAAGGRHADLQADRDRPPEQRGHQGGGLCRPASRCRQGAAGDRARWWRGGRDPGQVARRGRARPARLPRPALCRADTGRARQDGAGRSLARGSQGAQRAGAGSAAGTGRAAGAAADAGYPGAQGPDRG